MSTILPFSFMQTFMQSVTSAVDATTQTKTSRPNIVFILADDMGYGDPGCYNDQSQIPTPNMDQLAEQGVRFTDAHSPSAVCTPTRYGVLTGCYAWRSRLKRGVLNGYSRNLIDEGRTTVASLLKGRGYQTGCVGKWHLGFQPHYPGAEQAEPVDYGQLLTPGPNQHGFDYFWGIPASLDMPPYVYVENDQLVEGPAEEIGDSAHRRQGGGGFWRGGGIAPSFKHIDVLPDLTQQAVGYIERSASQANPFFLYFPLTAPHTPWVPIPEFEGKSGAGYYGDFTMQVDWSIGQVTDALKNAGVSDDTLIIVTSDNGSHWYQNDVDKFGHRSNRHWRGQKADVWEGGHRIPFIARWPGQIDTKTVCEQTICLTDLLATVADITGEAVIAEDSVSILPALLDPNLEKPLHEAIVNHSASGVFAIRQGEWKLIQGLGSGGFSSPRIEEPEPDGPVGQLYNLADDPGETENLYLDRPEIVEQLSELLTEYQQQEYSNPEHGR